MVDQIFFTKKEEVYGWLTRIYRDGTGATIGIDEFQIKGTTVNQGSGTWRRAGGPVRTNRTLLATSGGPQTIASIKTMGDYDDMDLTQNVATWTDTTGNTNDIVVSFINYPQIGDTLG